jgi:predicted nucleic acid-binding protein
LSEQFSLTLYDAAYLELAQEGIVGHLYSRSRRISPSVTINVIGSAGDGSKPSAW